MLSRSTLLITCLCVVLFASGLPGSPAFAATLTRGPYLQSSSPSSIVIRWRTAEAVASRVRFGSAPDSLDAEVFTSETTSFHEIKLSGLTAGTRYYYSVESLADTLAGHDSNHYFDLPPEPGDRGTTRILVLGDSGYFEAGHIATVRDAYYSYDAGNRPDLTLLLGDNAYATGLDSEFQAGLFDPYQTLLRNTVVWPSRGNHDFIHPGANNDYFEFFTLPDSAQSGGTISGTEAYYSFDRGNIHFVCLDSEGSDLSPGGAMMNWLQADLAANTQDWTIAYLHHPPYTRGNHDSDDPSDSGGRMTGIRENALPILEAGGVDLVLGGHSHSYERSFMLDGHYSVSSTLDSSMIVSADTDLYVKPTLGPGANEGAVYMVLGSSSRVVPGGTLDHPVMVSSELRLGFVVVEIDSARLDAVYVDETGVERDRFTMIKGTTNGLPSASFSAIPESGFSPLDVSFDASATTDPDGDAMNYNWDFGDGNTGGGAMVNHVYQNLGAYTVTLTVDDGELWSTARDTIYVTSTIDQDSVLAYWQLNETQGTTAPDIAGTWDGVLANGPVWQPVAGLGGALEFDGVDDRVDLAGADAGGGSGFSVVLRMRADDFDVHDGRLISKANGTAENAHWWMLSTINETGLRFRLKTDVTTTLVTGIGEIRAGEWFHVAATYDGAEMRIYINGQPIASASKTGPVASDPAVPVAIGNQPAVAGSDPFDGLIDDVRLYNVALSETDIQLLAGFTFPPTVATPTITPAGGTFADPVDVTLETATAGAAIYYTTDGSGPDTASTLFSVPFTVDVTAEVKARAFKFGLNPSATATAVFTIGTDSLPPTNPVSGTPYFVTGTTVFTKQVIGTGIDETHAVAAADFDRDGDLDCVATDYVDGAIYWWENDGAGGFSMFPLDASLAGAYPIGVADVNLDGDQDVLATGYLAHTVVWYESNGDGTFVRHDVDTAALGAHSVVTGDPDDDGDVDLLTTNQDEGSVAWYENLGGENFTRHTIDADASGAKRAEFADINGDGDLDVVSASYFDNEIAWYENDGNENFTWRSIDAAATGAYYVTPVDIDGDGDTDVLAASRLDNTIALHVNDGSGGFTKQTLDNAAGGARTVLAGDLDGDGDMDALAASVDDDTVARYINDGGVFTKQAVDAAADGAYGISIIDMDYDGDKDILSASNKGNEVAIHEQNRSHQAVLPNQGGTLIFDTALLNAVDADDPPGDVTYTISQIPASGELRVDGSPLPAGGTFTQQHINEYRVRYVHDGSASSTDRFVFTISDSTGSGGSGEFAVIVADLAGDLLAHWRLDETSGQLAADTVGGYNGTLTGGPVWNPAGGRIGGALTFDGTDDLVNLGPIDVTSTSGLTIALWVRPSQFLGSSRLISKADGTGEQAHYWMISARFDTALRFRLKAGGETSTLVSAQGELELDTWYHVACTYDQSEMRIYGNGNLLVSLPKTGTIDVNAAVAAAIGDQPPGAGSDPFAGDIDDVRLYGRALTDSEIIALASGEIVATGVEDHSTPAAGPPVLHQNVPNPFNPSTTVYYDLPEASFVNVQVFDVSGRLLRTLVRGRQPAGSRSVEWDGRDGGGQPVSSGVYFVRLQTPGLAQTRKIVLIK
jgi:PKD repeat protein